MDVEDCLTAGRDDGCDGGVVGRGAGGGLDDDDGAFHAVDRTLRYADASCRHLGQGAESLLDILRVDVDAAVDDEVLRAAGDVKVPLVQDAEVSGAQMLSVRVADEMSAEGLFSGVLVPPVAGRDSGAG
jgi:hypothetical protein